MRRITHLNGSAHFTIALSSFSLTVFIKFFLIQKSKSSTNLNCKKGKQEEATID